VEAFFETPDTIDVIQNLRKISLRIQQSISNNENVWTYQDKIALIGDASPQLYLLWSGMNAGFEDISVLYEMMEKYGDIGSRYSRNTKSPKTKCRCDCGTFVS
jgi:kynurenine 3-monooxygenase